MLANTRLQDLKSRISIGFPTQCVFDVVLVPLPTWIYLITVLTITTVAFLTKYNDKAVQARKQRSRVSRVMLGPADADNIKDKPWLRNTIVAMYSVIIAAVVALQAFEVARLFQADLGIGLTPFVFGGCAMAAVLRATKGFSNNVPGWQSASQLFWLVSAIVTIIKAVAVGRMLAFPGDRFTRRDSPYPTAEQLVVQVVLFVLYLMLLSVETIVQFFSPGYQSTLTKLKDFPTPEGTSGIEMMN